MDAHRVYMRKYMRELRQKERHVGLRQNVTTLKVPEEVRDERDRVMQAARELRHYLFGDPLPGRSALDKLDTCLTEKAHDIAS